MSQQGNPANRNRCRQEELDFPASKRPVLLDELFLHSSALHSLPKVLDRHIFQGHFQTFASPLTQPGHWFSTPTNVTVGRPTRRPYVAHSTSLLAGSSGCPATLNPLAATLLKEYSATQTDVGNMCALSHVEHRARHSIVASVESILQRWLQGPAFTAIQENRLHCKAAKLSFSMTKNKVSNIRSRHYFDSGAKKVAAGSNCKLLVF